MRPSLTTGAAAGTGAGVAAAMGAGDLVARGDLREADRWSTMSTVKSMTAMLVGVALADGSLPSLDIPVVRYLPALARGAATRDLSEDWSLWSDCARPLSELRAAYGVPPD